MHTRLSRRVTAICALALGVGLLGAAASHAALAQSARTGAHTHSQQSAPALRMGPVHMVSQDAWQGYYDGHKDTYLNTDVSVKGQAMMHVNYAPGLAHTSMASAPAIYLVKGPAVSTQLAVFGSEPGESDYSPIWHEVVVQWKAGAKPVLLTSDNQILALQKKGKLTARANGAYLNCPIIKVG